MADLFERLRKKREAAEAPLRQARAEWQAELRREEDSRNQSIGYVRQAFHHNRRMIERVLEQLRRAQYPNCELLVNDTKNAFSIELKPGLDYDRHLWRPHWSIGYMYDDPGEFEKTPGTYGWVSNISVMLEFDQQWQPYLKCWTTSQTKTCPCSERDLVRTLLELHGDQ